ncbi:MAG: hypothetical protein LAO30_15370 [Acidobacteriia bacterium]|nr:hypothetical protein [Terriglobia bacterium]
MIRWIAFMLLTGCTAAQVAGKPVQNPEAAQSQASEQAPAAPPGAPTPATGGFPFDQFKEFSAIMVGSVLSGDDRESHIYRSGTLLRTQATEGFGYYLTDLESFETYAITRLGCTSDSHPYFRAFPLTAGRPRRKFERVAAGKESVDGHMCQVEEVTVSSGDLTLPIKLKLWEAEDLHGFPIKVQVLNGGGRSIIQYKDVVVGPVDPSLFIRPKRCAGRLPQPPAKKPAKKKQTSPPAGKSQP